MKFVCLFFILFFNFATANVYLISDYKEHSKSVPVVTKHHIFLKQPYVIKYEKVKYIFTLKKIENMNRMTIESETYLKTPKGYDFISGNIWVGELKDILKLKQFSKNQENFILNLKFEKIISDKTY